MLETLLSFYRQSPLKPLHHQTVIHLLASRVKMLQLVGDQTFTIIFDLSKSFCGLIVITIGNDKGLML